tara:strand:- start:3235 stop:4149 length:915 start_codon:yes stop_codon:yes gene_type:complete
LTVAVEDAGFEIRDQIGWLQWQGFPKSMDVSKAIDKAAGLTREVIGEKITADGKKASARLAKRARGGKGGLQGDKYGTYKNDPVKTTMVTAPASPESRRWSGWGTALKPAQEPAVLARKPLDGTVAENVLKWGTGGLNIDATRIAYGDESWPGPSEELKTQISGIPGANGTMGDFQGAVECIPSDLGRWPANIYYCPKPSRGEKEEGCEDLQETESASPAEPGGWKEKAVKNYHPTVKPTKLMRWLLRLVTPQNAVVLEPFAGSGTTLVAAEREGFKVIAAEISPEYCDIIRARVEKAMNPDDI